MDVARCATLFGLRTSFSMMAGQSGFFAEVDEVTSEGNASLAVALMGEIERMS